MLNTDILTLPVHHCFESLVADRPTATALRHRDTALSYAELNHQSNHLAHWLIKQCIGAARPVAVLVEPGVEITIALLAILKSGNVYVPLDTNYPKARLQVILNEVQPLVVLTTAAVKSKLPPTQQPVFTFEDIRPALAALPKDNPTVDLDPTDTAYIYFTSGTTGKPKGVMASHGNLCQYLYSASACYGFQHTDVMPAVARYTFSISMFELMLPLIGGGTSLLLDRDHILDPNRMVQTFREITFFHIGPSLLKGLLAHIFRSVKDFTEFNHVRHASSGGDMIPPELLENLKRVFPSAEVYVIYGCSEVACMGCTFPVPRDAPLSKTLVGKPFPNVSLRLVDSDNRAVNPGEIGEICFGGAGVVKGYLNQPELTANKFIHTDADRFYATGDIGRMDSNGNLEMLGRRDFQIQLRGMRIELTEVEFALRRAPGVKDGVVMTKETLAGDKVLVAYVVFNTDAAQDTNVVKRYLVDQLPDYMVPSHYLTLSALPLNHNMKVDRFALPDIYLKRDIAAAELPQTDTEKKLAAIWQQLLNVNAVSIHDNFFDLGAYSLLAMDMIVAIEEQLGVTLDGMDVLRENLTVLATICDQKLGINPHKLTSRVKTPNNTLPCSAFYFGETESLYGVYYPANTATPKRAVLICPPIGNEWTLVHFIIRKLVERLVIHGVPVLRFDFYGTGDSLGNPASADIKRWCADIETAANELQCRSGTRSIVGVGIRLGASLLVKQAKDMSLSALLLWDPITSGTKYLAQARKLQKNLRRRFFPILPLLMPLITKSANAGGEELVSYWYSTSTLQDLEHFNMAEELKDLNSKTVIIDSSHKTVLERDYVALQSDNLINDLIKVASNWNWNKASGLEDILPDTGLSAAMANWILSS